MTEQNAGSARRRRRSPEPPPSGAEQGASGAPPGPTPPPDAAGWAGPSPGSQPPRSWSGGPYWTQTERLYRSVADRVFAGVCGGIAERYALDPALVRISWALLTLLTGIIPMLVLYILWALVVPEGPPGAVAPPDAGWSPVAAGADRPTGPGTSAGWPAGARPTGSGTVVVGLLLIAVGIVFLAREYLLIEWDVIWPAALVVIGIVIVVGASRRRA